MRVCYVTHKPNLTGASQSLLDMLSGWKGYDIEPTVLIPFHGPLEDRLTEFGVRTKIIRYTSAIKTLAPNGIIKDSIRMLVNRIYVVNALKKFFEAEKFDLIHNNSFITGVGMQAALELGIPYICHLRDYIEEDHKLEFLDKENQYYLLEKSSRAIAISNCIYNKFKSAVPRADIFKIYDGINVEKYYSIHSEILNNKDIKLLLPGRLSENKRQIDAIKAMEVLFRKDVKNVKLTIIGDPDSSDYGNRVYQYVEDNKVANVTFLPFGDLKTLRKETDIGLMCSSNEAMGRVTIESMLAGCLTIGANAGATPELIEDGVNGYLYEVGNPESLAEMIIRAIENKDEARRVAKIGQRYAIENYGVQAYCSKIYEIYRKVLQ